MATRGLTALLESCRALWEQGLPAQGRKEGRTENFKINFRNFGHFALSRKIIISRVKNMIFNLKKTTAILKFSSLIQKVVFLSLLCLVRMS